MLKIRIVFLLIIALCHNVVAQQKSPAFLTGKNYRHDEMQSYYLAPTRIVWSTDTLNKAIENSGRLLENGNGQADLSNDRLCILRSTKDQKPGLLLDFGKEIHGAISIVTDQSKGGNPIRIRIRLGESVSEAMSTVGPTSGATNDHAMRDMIVSVPWLGKLEIGDSGFRFVRIDLVDDYVELKLKEVSAVLKIRDIPYLGSFNSSDTVLNKIWMTGAYTVHLNMQNYIWDGIKRDRLVWIGDMHPETSTIAAVFGNQSVVQKSLDQARDITPYPKYMAGMVSYSMWWIIIQHDWFMHTGNLKYLKQQKSYLSKLLVQLAGKIDSENREILDGGNRFLDWASSPNKPAIHAGLQGMLILTLDDGAKLSDILGDQSTAKICRSAIAKLKKHVPSPNGSKQAAAMMALSGLMSPLEANKIISFNGVHNYSTFYGYYLLKAKAMAGDSKGAINDIKNYWGPMLNLGATTFWEEFNVDWVKNASPIDELVPAGKVDIHSAYGDYCYKGLRLSLAHGWASGPTPWLTENVLGIKVLAPGCKVVAIKPDLGDLSFAEGTFPTPLGLISVKHVRKADGTIRSDIKAPAGIKILR
ncbi:MAG: alpha-L-rhamnosidase [Sphingobacteriaceae bacterium]|nr:MAG: alpha-L-rhamnosidase [Sphingobacteriaceae bacterium]